MSVLLEDAIVLLITGFFFLAPLLSLAWFMISILTLKNRPKEDEKYQQMYPAMKKKAIISGIVFGVVSFIDIVMIVIILIGIANM